MRIEILNWGLSVSAPSPPIAQQPAGNGHRPATPQTTRAIFCDIIGQWRKAAVFDREALRAGDTLNGPALIVEPQTTTFVSADFAAYIDDQGNIWLDQILGARQ